MGEERRFSEDEMRRRMLQAGFEPDIVEAVLQPAVPLTELEMRHAQALVELRRLRSVIASAEQNGNRPMAYPVCPWCQTEYPAPHEADCPAFTPNSDVR